MERFSVKKPFTVLVAVIIVIALGVVSVMNMATDLLPEVSFPYLLVILTYPGASPERVESEVTLPLEQALGTVKNVKSVSTTSAENYGVVQLSFADGTNLDSAMVNVSSAVNRAVAGMPSGVGTPSILELSMDMIATMYVGVSREGYDIYELSDYVNKEVIPWFQRQNGVASVSAVGLVERMVQVELNGEKIDALNAQILEKTNSALADARAQLDEARQSVEDGQKALDEQQKRFGTTLASALFVQLDAPSAELQQKLSDGIGTLLVSMDALQSALDAAASSEDAAEGDLRYVASELNAAAEALNVAPEAAADALESAGAAIATLNILLESQRNGPGFAELRADLAEAESARAEAAEALANGDAEAAAAALGRLRNALAQAAADGQGMLARLQGNREEFRSLAIELASLRASLGVIGDELVRTQGVGHAFTHVTNAFARLSTLGSQLWELLDRISQADLTGRLSGELEQLRGGLSGLSERTDEIPALMGSLEGLVATLSQGQLDAALGFASASQQLMLAQTQLRTAETQYEQARRQALENANLDSLVSASTLSQLIYAQNFSMPAGYVEDAEGKSWLLRVGDEYGSSDALAGALLADVDGIGTIRLTDVADITVIDNAYESYANLDGADGIMLCIYKGSTAGTNEVSRNCVQAMQELRERDGALKLVRLLDQGKYITIIINSIVQSMALGAILAILILALFLKDLRPTIVVGVSIPLSVLFALVLMYFTGLSLNIMTLSGLALGIGMLVDNSIVVLENIVRLRVRGMAAPRASVQGAKQVTGAIIASTLTTISVFLPMIFTTGTVREMLVPLSLSVSYCLIASLLVAVTVIPASASTLLSRAQPKPNRLLERVQRRYGLWLRWCLRFKAVPLLVSVALLAFSLARLLAIGIVVLPQMSSDCVNISITLPEGVEKDEGYRTVDRVMERLLTVEGGEDVGIMDMASVVSSVGVTQGTKSYSGFICYITVPEGTPNSTIRRMCREAEAVTADLPCTVTADTASMIDFSAFSSSGLSVEIYGSDLDRLQEIAEDVAEAVADTEGFTEISNGAAETAATLHLRIDKDKAMEHGLTVAQIYMAIAGRLTTDVVSTTITADGLEMRVRVSNNTDPLTRENLLELELTGTSLADTAASGMADMMSAFGAAAQTEDAENTEESGAEETEAEEAEADEGETDESEPDEAEADEGEVLRLGDVATLEETASAASITRQDLTRVVTVTASALPGYNTTVLSRALQPKLDAIESGLPHGYRILISGESQQVRDMISQMLLLAGLGLLFIYLVMVAQFQSLLSPFIILFTIPLAFTGGMLALLIAQQQLSMLSIMGFLILMGTVVNNGIVFVDYTNQLRIGGLEKHDALVAAGQTRMRPILMTTLTTILAMVMLIFGDDMGSEMGGGMAIVITGGLLYATLMTLFIIPVMYDLLYRRKPLQVDVGEDVDDAPDDAADFLESLARERKEADGNDGGTAE